VEGDRLALGESGLLCLVVLGQDPLLKQVLDLSLHIQLILGLLLLDQSKLSGGLLKLESESVSVKLELLSVFSETFDLNR